MNDNISPEWRVLYDQLAELKTAQVKVVDIVTDIRINAVTSKHIDSLKENIEAVRLESDTQLKAAKVEADMEITQLKSRVSNVEGKINRAIGFLLCLQLVIGGLWAIFTHQ